MYVDELPPSLSLSASPDALVSKRQLHKQATFDTTVTRNASEEPNSSKLIEGLMCKQRMNTGERGSKVAHQQGTINIDASVQYHLHQLPQLPNCLSKRCTRFEHSMPPLTDAPFLGSI